MGFYDFTRSYHEPDSWDDLPQNRDDDIAAREHVPKGLLVALVLIVVAVLAVVLAFGVDESIGNAELVDAIRTLEVFVVVSAAVALAGLFLMVSSIGRHLKDERLVGWEAWVMGGFCAFCAGLTIFCFGMGALPGHFDDAESGPRSVTARLDHVAQLHGTRRVGPRTRFEYVTPEGERIKFTFSNRDDHDMIRRLKSYEGDVRLVFYPHASVIVSITPVDPVEPTQPERAAQELADAMQQWYDEHASGGEGTSGDGDEPAQ